MTDEEHDRTISAMGKLGLERIDIDVDRTVLAVTGEIDAYAAPEFREQLLTIEAPILVLDLTNVAYLDSTGLGVLVGQLKRCRAHDRQLRLIFDNQAVAKLLEVTGLTTVFPIYPNRASALAAA